MTAFADYLKSQREALKLSQRQMAAFLGVTERKISQWENGHDPLAVIIDAAICRFRNFGTLNASPIPKFHLLLKRERHRTSLTQVQTAKLLGLSHKKVWYIEHGYKCPPLMQEGILQRLSGVPTNRHQNSWMK